jgi:C-terminal processing protease CtpA/Prc/predicted small lipoprotein YifL
MTHTTRAASCTLVFIALAACGDDGPDILPAERYANQCVSPRSGTDPATDKAYLDAPGNLLDEKHWVQSWINDLYLWYREVPNPDISTFDNAVDYFAKLKTSATTASGKPKDQFHFTYETSYWDSLSASGVEAGYGVQWVLAATRPPRELVVAFVQPDTPGAAAGIARGAEVLAIDGVDLVNGSDVDTLNRGIAPPAAGESHSFVIRDAGAVDTRTVTLVSADISLAPVQRIALDAPNDKVGYLLFTDHIATAEKGLLDEVTKLRDAGITDLVLDLRYNGGGYLAIAAELAYMIAGPNATAGKVFDREQFNDKYTTIDPITGDALSPSPFLDQTVGLSVAPGQALPHLDLKRVFVLTSAGTCSASEAVMNGLAGVDVDVIQIGETTCGKPYGFYPADNCGTTFFAIQFQGVNAKGFGDYADGFTPGGVFHGCTVADDFTHLLGDPAEARLAAALAYRSGDTTCAVARRATAAANPLAAVSGGIAVKPQWRQNSIVRR